MRILITGGCGFVGSNLAIYLKHKHPRYKIFALDNLKRRGSELNLNRLKTAKISFIHGDIRILSDFKAVPDPDLIIDAAAEPAVLSGIIESTRYTIDTNLLGTINTLEYAIKKKAKLIFLSTSRVYPYRLLNKLKTTEKASRFQIAPNQQMDGAGKKGIKENFLLNGPKTPYGATKYASEILITEYEEFLGLSAIINRCGVIAGPWQMGKVDQGFLVHWLASHYWEKKLKYIGYKGSGKQVRDVLHIEDLFNLIDAEIANFQELKGQTFNVGGGLRNSTSLLELTQLCEKVTNKKINVGCDSKTRPGDVKVYITDNSKVTRLTKWKPKITISDTVEDVMNWLRTNDEFLKPIFT